MHNVIYLPCEIHNRDWDARLLIADYATALGLTCVVGQQWAMHAAADKLPPGVFLLKTLNDIQFRNAELFKAHGHKIAAMDEEVLAVDFTSPHKIQLPERLSEIADVFFANSTPHAAHICQRRPATRVATTGNPRFDLLTPQGRARFRAETDNLRTQYGPYVLFNSNGAQANSVWENRDAYLEIQVRAGALDPTDPASVEQFLGILEFEQANHQAFVSMLNLCLSNLPNHNIVLRPHPVERSDTWRDLARMHPNLHVVESGHHIPWIMAADAVVHTNSTTGLEAATLGTPVVNLSPMKGSYWDSVYVTSDINPTYANWEDGVRALHHYLEEGRGALADKFRTYSTLDRHFEPGGSAAEHIAEYMKLMLSDAEAVDFMHVIGGRLNEVSRSSVLRQKFTKTLVNAHQDFAAIRAATGLTHEVQMRELCDSCFVIL